ncbi:MAG: FG-GAP-like repeat-containing protein [bacterium]
MKILRYLLLAVTLAPSVAFSQFLFKDITAQAGIFMKSSGSSDAGPGAVVIDVNNDGWDDLYMAGGFDSDKLFLNMKDGTFMDIAPDNLHTHTDRSTRSWRNFPRGGIAFDYDNDGLTDLYTVCLEHDFLWHNNGDNTFTDVTREAQLNFPYDQNQSMTASFGDFDGDGDNDFYVARWVQENKFRQDTQGNINGYAHKGFPNWFYVNNGDKSFTERAKEFGVDGDTGTTNIALFFDYDRDGDLDLLIGNDFGVELTPNQVWKNMLMETGVATFVDVSKELNLGSRLFCMGIGPNDFNNDGNFDFYETSFGTDSLMMNNGNGSFTNVRKKYLPKGNGFERSGSGLMTTTWTALFADFDNDGWEDGLIVHGYEGAISPWITNPNHLDTSQFLHNIGGGYFEDYTDQALGEKYLDMQGRGAAYLDFNHDGKLDICYGSMSTTNLDSRDFRLLQNITPQMEGETNHWLQMRFHARRTAKEAIGTIVDVWAHGMSHSRQVSTGGGFGSQNSLMQQVGLGVEAKADSVIVSWPADKNRHRQIDRYYNVKADTLYYVWENLSSTPDPSLLSLSPEEPLKSVNHPQTQADVTQVYPNPVGKVINVDRLSTTKENHFEIYDLLGVKQLDFNCKESRFSGFVGNLRPGCYVLRVISGNDVVTKQFIKE